MRLFLKLLLVLAPVLCSLYLEAQTPMEGSPNMQRPQSGQNKGKGTKAVKTRNDSVVFKLKSFKLIDDLSRITEIKIDTTLNDFQVYHPAYKNALSVQSLGNTGASYQYADFFQRRPLERNFLFTSNYYDYGTWPGDVRYYNVTKPLTLLQYGQWFVNKPKGETILKVFHTQNINKNVNFGLYYNAIGSQGKYLNQEAKAHSLGIFTSGNFDQYDYWFTLGKNKLENQENGGLPNSKDIENPDIKPENITVWLTNVKSLNTNVFATLSHQFKLGTWKEMKEKNEVFQQFIPRVALMHIFEYQQSSRIFTEADPNPSFSYSDDRGTVLFYGKNHVPYINATAGSATIPATNDLSGQRNLSNKLILKFMEAPDRKYTFGKQVYIGNDMVNVYFPQEEKYIDTAGVAQAPLGLKQSHNYSNTYIGGSIFRAEGKFWTWAASGKSYLQGRNALDYELNGSLEKPLRTKKDTAFIRIYASMLNKTPDYFYEHYYSNHYKWENSFDKTYTLKIGATLDKPRWRLKAMVNYSIINKYVFFNEKALPEQASSEFSVVQAMINKDFKFGVLNIRNWAVYQHTTTNNYLALPQLTFRNSTYLESVLANVMRFQIGLDTRYETAYFADQYSPATGMFYRQSVEKIGDYAWMDVFLNTKIKRTSFYVKFSNLATQFVKGGYFTSPSYPAAVATLLFGLSWTFYD